MLRLPEEFNKAYIRKNKVETFKALLMYSSKWNLYCIFETRMKSYNIGKLTMALFLIGILSTTFFAQTTALRKKYSSLSISDCTWALKTPINSSTDTKKQIPLSTNIIEEEDKIVEEIIIECESHPILISLSFSFPSPLFEEPFLKVKALPPWA